MAGQQQEEIETIRSRTIEVKLSDADVKRISEKAAAHGLTVGELIENFIGDLVCGTYSKDDKTPQSQELRDLANTEDKYMRLVKSGYYDEKRAEKAAEKTEGGNGMEQMKKAPTKGGFSERREALKTKVQDALRKQEHSKTHDIGHSR